ncbi:hypothetical protein [Endozoicomonas sp. SCSIO W0465]|uniref:hypothetical protein n=1 Tax=Endozoicomonas sp. SCSIO W0465 TaxID=2918516 RepID=UPI0020762AC3|nr:hypothetical protein [Endozoicomonas sp. SCSIO W0465]USE36225.1 hypothetical protein MJO57_30020 [Endozoicomonas sp. SCSIO W0465]
MHGINHNQLSSAQDQHHQHIDPKPSDTTSRQQWLSSKAARTVNRLSSGLRSIPNPVYMLLSAPGRVIALLSLAGRSIADVTSASASPASMQMESNLTAVNSSIPVPSNPPVVLPKQDPAWMAKLREHNTLTDKSDEAEGSYPFMSGDGDEWETDTDDNDAIKPKSHTHETRVQSNLLEIFEQQAQSDAIDSEIVESETMGAKSTRNEEAVSSRQKRAPIASYRGGGGRGGSSRGSSSRGGSRSRGSRRGGSRWGGSRTHSGVRSKSSLPKRGGSSKVAFHGYRRHGSYVYKEYVRTTRDYYTGKHWLKIGGQKVDLYKNSLHTQSGHLKHHITTSQGSRYKVAQVKSWSQIKTDHGITINALSKVAQFKHGDSLFKLAACSIFFNTLWNNSLEMYFLSGQNTLLRLLFKTNDSDNTKIDIGYYENNTDEQPTSGISSPAAANETVTDSSRENKKFIRIATIPKGDNLRFAILNNEQPKREISPTPVSKNNGSTSEISSRITPEPDYTPALQNSNHTNINDTALVKETFNPIYANNTEANNITRINALLAQQNISTSAKTQLVIMGGDEKPEIIPLSNLVDKFLFHSDNDTLLTYSMNGPKVYNDYFGHWIYSPLNSATENSGNMLWTVMATIAAQMQQLLPSES